MAINTAAYILNRTRPIPVKQKSPIELWNNKPVKIDHLKIFGTECFVYLPKQKRQKFDQKSNKGFLVGYCGEKEGLRVWLPKMNKIECSRNVTFKPESTVQKRLELVVNSNINTGSNNDNPGDIKERLLKTILRINFDRKMTTLTRKKQKRTIMKII